MPLLDLFFNLKGRIGRLTYAIAQLPVGLLNTLLIAMIFTGYGRGEAPIFAAFGLMIGLYAMNALNVKRLHDIYKSGWWLMLSPASMGLSWGALPLIFFAKNNTGLLVTAIVMSLLSLVLSIWLLCLFFQMLFFAGTPGSNNFGGPAPRFTQHIFGRYGDDEAQGSESPSPVASKQLSVPPPAMQQRTPTVQSSGFGRRGTVRPA